MKSIRRKKGRRKLELECKESWEKIILFPKRKKMGK